MRIDIISNAYIILYIIAWLTILYAQNSKNKNHGPTSVVIITYIFYAILSLILYNSNFANTTYGTLTLFPFVYLFIMLIITLMPGIKYERANIQKIQMPSVNVLYSFIIIYGFCSLIILPENFSYIPNGLRSLLYDNGGLELYKERHYNFVRYDNSISGLFGLFNVIHNYFRDINLFIIFYYLTLPNKKRWIIIYSFIILIVDMLLALSSGGRTAVVITFITIGVCYFMFHNYWDRRVKRLLKTLCLFLLSIIAVPFIVLTISRFGENDEYGGTLGSIISYGGMENLNFNQQALDAGGTRNGDKIFNVFKGFLGYEVPGDYEETRLKYNYMKLDDSVFSTFIGDFVMDFGPYLTPIILIAFSLFFLLITKPKQNSLAFHQLLIVYFTLCICGQGGMYLFAYGYKDNWVIIAFIFAYIIFYFDYYLIQKDNHYYIYLRRKS